MIIKTFIAQKFDEPDFFFAMIKRIKLQAINETR